MRAASLAKNLSPSRRRRSFGARLGGLGLVLLAGTATPRPEQPPPYGLPQLGPRTFPALFRPKGPIAMRGVTLGPIESRLQPNRGYGSPSFDVTLDEIERLGGNWLSLTVFGRVFDLTSTSIDPAFEAPLEETLRNMTEAARMAHARGLKVMLVPHLWVESGGWRAELNPGSEEGWRRFRDSYGRFIRIWAEWAERNRVELFSTGVELRFWVTSSEAKTFQALVAEVRDLYHGPLTYASNWDDADDTEIWRSLDVIGVNGFYPLHWENSPSDEQLDRGAIEAARRVRALGERFERPVFFSEFGYTTRKDSMVEPWLWPEQLSQIVPSEADQARSYAALLSQVCAEPNFLGAFVWRMYSDIADLSQEPAWGFNPWGKQAESVLRDAFSSRFAVEKAPAATFEPGALRLLSPQKRQGLPH